jgi:hypothetical protein
MFNIAKMSKVLGKHFGVSTKPKLSETSYFFEADFYWKQLENKQEMKASRFMKWNNCIN